MKFRITPHFLQRFPDLAIGVISARGVDNHGEVDEITALLGEAQRNVAASFERTPIREHPRIAAWREAYRSFGSKPKKYPSSVENLARRAMKGEKLRHINKLVDLYNVASLKHLLPVGGEDLDRVQGDIILTFADEGEAPVRMLGETEERAPHVGEAIYRDDLGTICRRWNWKEADRTKLTESTSNAVLVVEALPPATRQELEAALKELAASIESYCGGIIKPNILFEDLREVDI
jgi:lysyl-tRNA synthetase class 2